MSGMVLLALTAALNPTLLGATTVMILLPSPKRLMLGYLLGAMMTSITLGLVIVFSLQGSGSVTATQRSLSPAADVALGTLALVVAYVLATDRDARLRERRHKSDAAAEVKVPPRWQRVLSRGSPRMTFVVGALLTLPGASYLAGMHRLSQLKYSPAGTTLAVIGFNLVMLVVLELPLVSFAVAPDATPHRIDRGKRWIGRSWRRLAVRGAGLIGAALIVKGLVGLVV